MRRKRSKHRKHAYNRRHTKHKVRHSRRNKGRKGKVSAYVRFVSAKMRSGISMKAAARMWPKQKR